MADPRYQSSSSKISNSSAAALPKVGKFANYECVEFEYSNPTVQNKHQTSRSTKIKDLPFEKMPAQVLLSSLGCSHKKTDKLSIHPKGKLVDSINHNQTNHIEIPGFNDPSKKLKISTQRIKRLAESAKLSIDADIFPSQDAYVNTLGKHQDQEQSFEAASRHPWLLLATAICHVQEIDFLVDYQIDSQGRALPVARSGEIQQNENPIILISKPAINFVILQAIERDTGFYLDKPNRLRYMRAFFRHQFQETKESGCSEFYLLASGLGAFAPANLPDSKYQNSSSISKEYFESLLYVASEFPGLNIIYNPERGVKEFNEIKLQFEKSGLLPANLQTTDQDVNALAWAAQKSGRKVALANASDADVMYATMDVGQNWKSGHCAAEEVLGKLTTAPLGSFGLNPAPFQAPKYESMLQKVGNLSCEAKASAEHAQFKNTLNNVGSFAKYACAPFEIKSKGILKSKKTSNQIQEIPFDVLPSQQMLSQLGCKHSANDPLSYYQTPQGDLSSAFQSLSAKSQAPNSKSKQKLELLIQIKPFSDSKDQNKELIIPISRIQHLHQSSRIYINSNIFPSKAAYQTALGKVKPQDPTANKDSLEMWMLLATSICHVQEIDFYVDYRIQDGNAIAVPREGEIKTHEPTILLISSPSINFRLLQKIEKADPKNLYFLGPDKMKVYMEEYFRNQLQAVEDSGRKTYYMLAAGLGPFLPNEAEIFPGSQIPSQKEIASAYYQALMIAAKDFPELNIVYNPGAFRNQYQEVATKYKPTNIEMTSQDVYALAVDAQKRGENVALSNSSDQDAMLGAFDLGQYWKQGHVAAEEVLGKFTSCSLGSFGLNKSPFLNPAFRHVGNIHKNRLEDLKKNQHYSNQKYLYELRRIVENADFWKGETSFLKEKPKVVIKVEEILNLNLSENEKILRINDYVEKREASQQILENKPNPISSSAKVANKAANDKTRIFMKCILRKNFRDLKKTYQVGVAVSDFGTPAFASNTASASTLNTALIASAAPAPASNTTSAPSSTAAILSPISSLTKPAHATSTSVAADMAASRSTSSEDEKKENEKGSSATSIYSPPSSALKIDFLESENDPRANILKRLQEQHEKIQHVRESVKQMHTETYSEKKGSMVSDQSLFSTPSTNTKKKTLDFILSELKSLNEKTKKALTTESGKKEIQHWMNQLSELQKNPYALIQSLLSGFQFIVANNGDISERSLTDKNIFVELYALRQETNLSMMTYLGLIHELLDQYQKSISNDLGSRLFLLQDLNEEIKQALFFDDEKLAEQWINQVSVLMKTPEDLFKSIKEAFDFISTNNGDVSNRSESMKNPFIELYALRKKTDQSQSIYVELLDQISKHANRFSPLPKNG